MAIDSAPLLSMVKSRLAYLGRREKVIAENVANASTPGYVARDLKPFSLRGGPAAPTLTPVAPSLTSPMHLASRTMASGRSAPIKAELAPGSEVTLDGNAVSLEDEMIKMAEARRDYDAAIGFYQKSMGLLKLAARAPGR